MKKLFASARYSFNNFYDNLNDQGQIVFSVIISLLILLCVLLFITYVVQNINAKRKLRKLKNESSSLVEVKEEIEENLYLEEKTEIEDIAKRVEEALKEDAPITLTNFEEDQEKTAIISIDELMKRAKELELIDDEEPVRVNYLEKYNLEPSYVKEVADKTMNNVKEEPKDEVKEVKAFKVSQVISPIYGIKKEVVDNKNK